MFSLRTLAIVAAGLVTLGGCAKAPQPVADTAADEATIRTMGSEWFKAYAAGDADAVAAQYAEDAVLSAPNAPAVRGGAAIREYYAADIAEMKAEGLVDEQGTVRRSRRVGRPGLGMEHVRHQGCVRRHGQLRQIHHDLQAPGRQVVGHPRHMEFRLAAGARSCVARSNSDPDGGTCRIGRSDSDGRRIRRTL